jgi:hypothetical protein
MGGAVEKKRRWCKVAPKQHCLVHTFSYLHAIAPFNLKGEVSFFFKIDPPSLLFFHFSN